MIFTNPNLTTYGSTFGTKASYNYKSPGYGTRFGTSFVGGIGEYGQEGFSEKLVGLGVGPGFLDRHVLGKVSTKLGAPAAAAVMGVYHKYVKYRDISGELGDNTEYYENDYDKNQCQGGCPELSHCEWGHCHCDSDFDKK